VKTITVDDFCVQGYAAKVADRLCEVEGFYYMRGGSVEKAEPAIVGDSGVETYTVLFTNGETITLSYDYTLSVQWLQEEQS
jgi:hypothetical protein